MAVPIIMVVGKSPLDDKYGFDAVSEMTYGSFIPNKISGVFVEYFTADLSDGIVAMKVAGEENTLGLTATVTLDSGESVVLDGVDGVYTLDALEADLEFTAVVASNLDGVQNMTITPSV